MFTKSAPSNRFESTLQDTNSFLLNPTFEDINKLSQQDLSKHLEEIAEEAKHSIEYFPYDVFPEAIREIVKQTNSCLGFHTDFISASLFFVVATSIGNTFKLYFKSDWIESCILYMALVGGRGTNKSHPPKWSLKPIESRDNETFEEWEKVNAKYKEDEALYKKGETTEPPKKPHLSKIIVTDYTPEALCIVHSHNRRGLCLYIDELAAWFKNFNRYNKGSEQEDWLTMWNGGTLVKDRVSKDALRLSNPFIPVIGTVQPIVLESLGKDNRSENGFTDRILFVWPENLSLPSWDTEDMPAEFSHRWHRIVNKLLDLQMATGEDGKEKSNIIKLTPEAKAKIIEWQRTNLEDDQELDSDIINGISAKLQPYTLRFSLILQLMRWACGEADNSAVDAQSVESAIRITKYFKAKAIKVANYINSKSPVDRLKQYQQDLYKSLPFQFETATGIRVAKEGDFMKERAFKEWIKNSSLFKNPKHGFYEKLYHS